MVGLGLDYACAHIIPASVNLLPIQADFVTERVNFRLRVTRAGPPEPVRLVRQWPDRPLLTIRVKYCDSTSFLVDSLPRGARTMLYIPADRMRSWAWFCVCARCGCTGHLSVEVALEEPPPMVWLYSPGTQAFPVYAVRYNTRTRR